MGLPVALFLVIRSGLKNNAGLKQCDLSINAPTEKSPTDNSYQTKD